MTREEQIEQIAELALKLTRAYSPQDCEGLTLSSAAKLAQDATKLLLSRSMEELDRMCRRLGIEGN